MTQYERMKAGLVYDPMDKDILEDMFRFQDMLWEFNKLKPSDIEQKNRYMKEVFAECGDNCYIQNQYGKYNCSHFI